MAEFKLSYTANEINEKLGKVDRLVSTVNGVSPDPSGNVEVSGGGIIDVVELPTENINEGAFYRLMTAKWVVYGEEVSNGSVCYCVNGLPESGQVVTSDMSVFIGYYNIPDNDVYGYVDTALGGAFGIPAGWYPFSSLAQISGLEFNGIMTDIDNCPDNNYFGVLLSKDYYIYQDGWCKIPFACEKEPEFDIQWDGDMTGKFTLDMSLLGYDEGLYYTKVSDNVISVSQAVGSTISVYVPDGGESIFIDENLIDTESFVGAFVLADLVVVAYASDELNTALGLPDGTITNGIYFFSNANNGYYINRLVAPTKVVKIDEKYLPDMSVDVNSLGLASVATSGNYNDLYNRPNLNNYVTTSQLNNYVTTSQLNDKLSEAITSAIGGSY